MTTSSKDSPGTRGEKKTAEARAPWYAGQYKDALLYLLIAILLTELVVGIIAFFYGLMHAAPETPGGPPLARFPWLAWATASVLAPVGLLLIVHLTGGWISHVLHRDQAETPDRDEVPERLQRFYAIIRNAPTIVVLAGILLLGAALIFVDGALSTLALLGERLMGYTPWLAGSAAALLTVCYIAHRWFIYRQRRMEQEYAYRHEVLQRTGIVLVDKGCAPLPRSGDETQYLPAAGSAAALPQVLDVAAGEATPDDDNATNKFYLEG
ncbi:MAG: hypothetical protein LBB60_04270 [Desulfovibrio sp.]|jgi:membrane protein implicated in regulation of membrane protease activity|nr:hypothetical protein [Desulfovibrio sp.]